MIKKLNHWFFPHDHKQDHFKSLDGLRGIAILIVIIAHGNSYGELYIHPIVSFKHFGVIGVFLFFILSSYLLDRQIMIKISTGSANRRYWANYVLRRFLRIYPLFFLTLVFYYLLNRKYLANFIKSPQDVWDHLVFNKAEYFYWSIPVEFKYYLISPLLLLLMHYLFKWRLKLVVTFIITVIAFSFCYEQFVGFGKLSTVKYFPVFLIGTLLAILEIRNPGIIKNKLLWNVAGLSSALLIIGNIVYHNEYLFSQLNAPQAATRILPYGILMGVIFVSAKYGEGLITKITSWKLLRFFGTISFSLYLLHWFVIIFINKYGLGETLWDSIIYYILCVLIASSSYLIVEYPLSKIRLRRSRKGVFKQEYRVPEY